MAADLHFGFSGQFLHARRIAVTMRPHTGPMMVDAVNSTITTYQYPANSSFPTGQKASIPNYPSHHSKVHDMPYSLRDLAKLKRPARYRHTTDEESTTPEPTSSDQGTDVSDQDAETYSQGLLRTNTAAANPDPSNSSSFTTDAVHFTQNSLSPPFMSNASHAAPTSASNLPNPQESRKMANIKYVKKRSADGQQPQVAPARDLAMRPSRTSQRAAAPTSEPESTHVPRKPAAFPSLPANAPPLAPMDPTFSGHGVRELMAAMETNDETRMEHIKDHFKIKYEAGTDPWYAALRRRWDPEMVDSKVRETEHPGAYVGVRSPTLHVSILM